jgi:hypothetical protein
VGASAGHENPILDPNMRRQAGPGRDAKRRTVSLTAAGAGQSQWQPVPRIILAIPGANL